MYYTLVRYSNSKRPVVNVLQAIFTCPLGMGPRHKGRSLDLGGFICILGGSRGGSFQCLRHMQVGYFTSLILAGVDSLSTTSMGWAIV